jgi:1,4-dihydroxy-2-naphthoate octaprenyltransferase
MLTGFLYSAKPFYFSGRPVCDFLANASGYGLIAFGVGWRLAGAPIGLAFVAACAPYFFLMCAGSISSTLPDYDGDRKHGKNTTAVWLGPIVAHLIAFGFIVLGLAAAFFVRDWPAAVCGGIAAPLYAAHSFRNSAQTMEASYKIGGMILMLAAATLFPYLVPASILLLVATIVYFRLRFHVRYPSLVPDASQD